jgi:hypothetical protein
MIQALLSKWIGSEGYNTPGADFTRSGQEWEGGKSCPPRWRIVKTAAGWYFGHVQFFNIGV